VAQSGATKESEMKKMIRVYSYILMILGAVIVLGGLGTGVTLLLARGARIIDHAQPFLRMMGQGSAVTTALKVMLDGLMVSGFGMLLYLVGEIAKPKDADVLEVSTKRKRI
jgi:hypothetical protein